MHKEILEYLQFYNIRFHLIIKLAGIAIVLCLEFVHASKHDVVDHHALRVLQILNCQKLFRSELSYELS